MYKQITNHYHEGIKRPKLCTRQHVLWEPNGEWSYAHHAQLIWFKGKYYVMFSSGRVNEDDVGQRIMLTTSEDFEEWSEPEVLVDSMPGIWAEAVLSPGTWYTDGETLTAYHLCFEYAEDWLTDGHRRPGSRGQMNFRRFMRSTTDGTHWSEPVFCEMEGGNQKPRPLASGRLLCPGGTSHSITDDPSGLTGWRTVSCCESFYPNSEAPEDGDGTTPSGVVNNTTVGLCEADWVQQADGTIWMFMRSGTNYLWASRSTDDGETWTLPEPTNFTDNRTKFALGRLPSGKYFYVGTPDPFPPRTRHVLVLSLSEDGIDYNQHFLLDDTQYKGKYVGLDKNGIYGYPSVLVRDGYLMLVCSICKETIISMKLPVESL